MIELALIGGLVLLLGAGKTPASGEGTPLGKATPRASTAGPAEGDTRVGQNGMIEKFTSGVWLWTGQVVMYGASK